DHLLIELFNRYRPLMKYFSEYSTSITSNFQESRHETVEYIIAVMVGGATTWFELFCNRSRGCKFARSQFLQSIKEGQTKRWSAFQRVIVSLRNCVGHMATQPDGPAREAWERKYFKKSAIGRGAGGGSIETPDQVVTLARELAAIHIAITHHLPRMRGLNLHVPPDDARTEPLISEQGWARWWLDNPTPDTTLPSPALSTSSSSSDLPNARLAATNIKLTTATETNNNIFITDPILSQKWIALAKRDVAKLTIDVVAVLSHGVTPDLEVVSGPHQSAMLTTSLHSLPSPSSSPSPSPHVLSSTSAPSSSTSSSSTRYLNITLQDFKTGLKFLHRLEMNQFREDPYSADELYTLWSREQLDTEKVKSSERSNSTTTKQGKGKKKSGGASGGASSVDNDGFDWSVYAAPSVRIRKKGKIFFACEWLSDGDEEEDLERQAKMKMRAGAGAGAGGRGESVAREGVSVLQESREVDVRVSGVGKSVNEKRDDVRIFEKEVLVATVETVGTVVESQVEKEVSVTTVEKVVESHREKEVFVATVERVVEMVSRENEHMETLVMVETDELDTREDVFEVSSRDINNEIIDHGIGRMSLEVDVEEEEMLDCEIERICAEIDAEVETEVYVEIGRKEVPVEVSAEVEVPMDETPEREEELDDVLDCEIERVCAEIEAEVEKDDEVVLCSPNIVSWVREVQRSVPQTMDIDAIDVDMDGMELVCGGEREPVRKSQPQPESALEPQVVCQTQPPELLSETEPEIVVETEAESTVESQPETSLETPPEPVCENEPEPVRENEPEPMRESQTEPLRVAQPEIMRQTQSAPTRQTQPEPTHQIQSEPIHPSQSASTSTMDYDMEYEELGGVEPKPAAVWEVDAEVLRAIERTYVWEGAPKPAHQTQLRPVQETVPKPKPPAVWEVEHETLRPIERTFVWESTPDAVRDVGRGPSRVVEVRPTRPRVEEPDVSRTRYGAFVCASEPQSARARDPVPVITNVPEAGPVRAMEPTSKKRTKPARGKKQGDKRKHDTIYVEDERVIDEVAVPVRLLVTSESTPKKCDPVQKRRRKAAVVDAVEPTPVNAPSMTPPETPPDVRSAGAIDMVRPPPRLTRAVAKRTKKDTPDTGKKKAATKSRQPKVYQNSSSGMDGVVLHPNVVGGSEHVVVEEEESSDMFVDACSDLDMVDGGNGGGSNDAPELGGGGGVFGFGLFDGANWFGRFTRWLRGFV
ncbi:hypothetical protein HDU76_000520, partial [Blyttiomyces sp. JEL0837]